MTESINNNKPLLSSTLWIVFYIVLFVALQSLFQIAAVVFSLIGSGFSASEIGQVVSSGDMVKYLDAPLFVVSEVLSSLVTIFLFALTRWAPVSRSWLRTRQWGVLFWAAVAALGTVIPSVWLQELSGVDMPQPLEKFFESLMREPTGYIAIGLMAPIAEEVVFRGAILRKLLGMFEQRQHWIAIAISAIIFGAVHGNLAQGVHAMAIGLLLGWMYYRTRSVIPGIAFHWMNNTVGFVAGNLLPQGSDPTLLELFGSETKITLAIVFSLCVFIPCLLQLHVRMKRVDQM